MKLVHLIKDKSDSHTLTFKTEPPLDSETLTHLCEACADINMGEPTMDLAGNLVLTTPFPENGARIMFLDVLALIDESKRRRDAAAKRHIEETLDTYSKAFNVPVQ